MWLNSDWTRCLRELEDDLLGLVDEVRRLARPLPAEPCDLGPDADQPAQGRHLADDLRVVPRVGRGRDERGQLVDALAAAGALQVAALLELVDERDRVDRLAARVQGKGSAVDLGVALAVEVARVEDFADRPDRARGQHHRAEDGLLGIEILGRDRGGLHRLGERGHVGITPGWKDGFQRVDNRPSRRSRQVGKGRGLQGEGTHVRLILPSRSDVVPQLAEQNRRAFFALASGFFVHSSTGPGKGCG